MKIDFSSFRKGPDHADAAPTNPVAKGLGSDDAEIDGTQQAWIGAAQRLCQPGAATRVDRPTAAE